MSLCICRVVAQCVLVGNLYLIALSVLVGQCSASNPMVRLAQLLECESVFLCKVGPIDCRAAYCDLALNGNDGVKVTAAQYETIFRGAFKYCLYSHQTEYVS